MKKAVQKLKRAFPALEINPFEGFGHGEIIAHPEVMAGEIRSFISDDRQTGGHVVDLRSNAATVCWDYTQEFSMKLPDSEAFKDYDLTVDQSEDIKKVETGESK